MNGYVHSAFNMPGHMVHKMYNLSIDESFGCLVHCFRHIVGTQWIFIPFSFKMCSLMNGTEIQIKPQADFLLRETRGISTNNIWTNLIWKCPSPSDKTFESSCCRDSGVTNTHPGLSSPHPGGSWVICVQSPGASGRLVSEMSGWVVSILCHMPQSKSCWEKSQKEQEGFF